MALASVLAAGSLAGTADASRFLKAGIYDDAQTIFGNPERAFPILDQLGAQLLRVNLYWGGPIGVARRRPAHPTDPADPAYNWAVYDRAVLYGALHRIKIVFSIYRTPAWAGGGARGNRVPTRIADLQRFAYAAATRYSGTFERTDGRTLPAVKQWLAWNEPNNPNFLSPQFRRRGSRWVVQSPVDYARICNAVYAGIHGTLLRNEQVACGVTSPRGNNSARSSRPSISPLVFLQNMKRAGTQRFDAYAHHPYYGRPFEIPTTRPPERTALTLGNIDVLVKELTRLYAPKRLWITQYGYQTRPPDTTLGVSWATQARYLTQAYAIARRQPRIDMMLWFLIRDDTDPNGWQSGFLTTSGRRKPAFAAFQRMVRTLR